MKNAILSLESTPAWNANSLMMKIKSSTTVMAVEFAALEEGTNFSTVKNVTCVYLLSSLISTSVLRMCLVETVLCAWKISIPLVCHAISLTVGTFYIETVLKNY